MIPSVHVSLDITNDLSPIRCQVNIHTIAELSLIHEIRLNNSDTNK